MMIALHALDRVPSQAETVGVVFHEAISPISLGPLVWLVVVTVADNK